MAHGTPTKGYPAKVRIKGRVIPSHSQVTNDAHDVSLSGKGNPHHRVHSKLQEDDDEICHKAAVVRCGWMLIKTFKFLEFLPPQQVELHKCAFRSVSTLLLIVLSCIAHLSLCVSSEKAFFDCLTKIGETNCTSSGKIHQPGRFRQRLVRTLWNTKQCVLG